MKWIVFVFLVFPTVALAEKGIPTQEDVDVVIRYGSDASLVIGPIVEALANRGITARAVPGLDDPNCAAIIMRGEERYRYSGRSITQGRLGATIIRLVNGDRIGRRADSDCED